MLCAIIRHTLQKPLQKALQKSLQKNLLSDNGINFRLKRIEWQLQLPCVHPDSKKA